MFNHTEQHGMFYNNKTNQGLWSFLNEKQATPEQEHDLLQFRAIGQATFVNFVKGKIIQQPTTDMPVHRKRLRTFTLTKTQKQQIKQVERDRWLQVNFLKCQISYIAKEGVHYALLNSLYGPVSPVSKPLVDHHGLPYKASKSVTTGYLEKR